MLSPFFPEANMTFYVYCGDRGWWNASGGYTSDFKQAKQFTEAEAIKFCHARYSKHDDTFQAMPIAEYLITQVRG